VIGLIAVTAAVGDKFTASVEMPFFDAEGISHADAISPTGL
jgi:hypothetical protein